MLDGRPSAIGGLRPGQSTVLNQIIGAVALTYMITRRADGHETRN